eukprot:GILK01002998.1.p1 GENE.GILK01002998.1~~GILK01002998.1.p1  ORF type:complete len:543 (-),score=135.01 GILK01002998.1:59-1645(-)
MEVETSKKRKIAQVTGHTEEQENILRLLQEAEQVQVDTLDLQGLKRMLTAFDKKFRHNEEMRLKYPDQPEKFMDSEVDLDEEVKRLHQLAAAPELWLDVVKLGAVPKILGLLAHPNVDMSIDAVELLSELTEPDSILESDAAEGGLKLADAFLSEGMVPSLQQLLARLDESRQEDAQAVHHILAIFENLAELRPVECKSACGSAGILTWLVQRLRQKKMDANKLYASEVLAILLQDSADNQRLVGEGDSLDHLLLVLSAYRKRNPSDAEEEELVHNLFDCLCSCLLVPANQKVFRESEGIELLLRMMKEKLFCTRLALKAMDYALVRCSDNCNRFVEKLGLKSIFAAFMRKLTIGKKKRAVDEKEDDEHILSCLSWLVRLTEGEPHLRVLYKFKENDFEKLERLVEMHQTYAEKVAMADRQLQENRQLREKMRQELAEDEDEEEVYMERLEAGLFILQLIDLVMIQLLGSADTGIKQRLLLLLQQQDIDLAQIRQVVQEYLSYLGGTDEEKQKETQHFEKLLESVCSA